MAGSSMEVDPHMSSCSVLTAATDSIAALYLNPLKRSNSAPMINVAVEASGCTTSTTPHQHSPVIPNPTIPSRLSSGLKPIERMRRFSTSSMALHSPTTPVKIPNRLEQIKREENLSRGQGEVAHEREVQSAMQLSQSMEEISVDESVSSAAEAKRPKSFGEPLHINTYPLVSFPYASSPSPTRGGSGTGRQCFSPSLQQHIKNYTLTPSPSPSPTRKSFVRRSLSPITLRPSPLQGKRKMELESSDRLEMYFSPPKRFQTGISPLGGSTPDRSAILSHPLLSRVTSSCVDEGSSPDQRVPSISVHSTGSSTPSTASPASCFSFRPVRDAESHTTTDSETSDMADVSEQSEGGSVSSSYVGPEPMEAQQSGAGVGLCDGPCVGTGSPQLLTTAQSTSHAGSLSNPRHAHPSAMESSNERLLVVSTSSVLAACAESFTRPKVARRVEYAPSDYQLCRSYPVPLMSTHVMQVFEDKGKMPPSAGGKEHEPYSMQFHGKSVSGLTGMHRQTPLRDPSAASQGKVFSPHKGATPNMSAYTRRSPKASSAQPSASPSETQTSPLHSSPLVSCRTITDRDPLVDAQTSSTPPLTSTPPSHTSSPPQASHTSSPSSHYHRRKPFVGKSTQV